MLWLFVGMEPIIPFIRSNAKRCDAQNFHKSLILIWSIIGKSDAVIIRLQINVQAWTNLRQQLYHAEVKYL